MTWRADSSAREQALHAEDVIASAKSLSAQARTLREHGRELAYLAKLNRSEADALSVSTRQLLRNTHTLLNRWRNRSDVEKTGE